MGSDEAINYMNEHPEEFNEDGTPKDKEPNQHLGDDYDGDGVPVVKHSLPIGFDEDDAKGNLEPETRFKQPKFSEPEIKVSSGGTKESYPDRFMDEVHFGLGVIKELVKRELESRENIININIKLTDKELIDKFLETQRLFYDKDGL